MKFVLYHVVALYSLTYLVFSHLSLLFTGTIQYINISCMCNIYCIPLFWTLRVVLLVQL